MHVVGNGNTRAQVMDAAGYGLPCKLRGVRTHAAMPKLMRGTKRLPVPDHVGESNNSAEASRLELSSTPPVPVFERV